MRYTARVLAIANLLFFVFHTSLILFNVFGWIPRRTRRWNLATLLLTAFSWLVMGLWKGVGYCVCTDWHWQVRRAIGIRETSDSYLVLMIRNLSGWDPPVSLVNQVASVAFAVSFGASLYLNWRDWKRARGRDDERAPNPAV